MKHLKTKLHQYGPLRPQAWQCILESTITVDLRENESFIRQAGTIAFLSSGLLKEYDARHRTKPAIINFINTEDFFLCAHNPQSNYIRACAGSHIYLMHWPAIEKLYHRFRELKTLYDAIASGYNEQLAYRQFLLEESSATTRISLFIATKRAILPMLKKKDIANYLHINYDHFVRLYSKLL